MSSQREMQQTLQNLGINVDTLDWTDLASCRSTAPDLLTGEADIFFDKYEKDPNQARATDETCLRCPVTKECFEYGQDNDLDGVWGGFYLRKGALDPVRNKHKTEEIVRKLSHRIFDV